MAGHSQFKNIMHRKGAQDKKRAKLFTKIIREIITASKINTDPNFNPKLRKAIDSAKEVNMPKDKIENAIKRGSSSGAGDNYEDMRYEGYGPGGIAIIVEALTDNRNRTASEVRAAFTKSGGQMGETGSVSYMFDRIGLIVYPISKASNDDMLEAAVEAGADDCISDDENHEIITSVENFYSVKEAVKAKFGEPENAEIIWRPQTLNKVEGENAEKLLKLIDTLEDNDDVQNVYGNYEFNSEFMAKIN
ncbi:MAG: YebC/PmpR family DNA-binding transcriptional regulator [Sphingobacteriia bacterium]|nr:YebC/PmpR family DNA-binding transcriptional regulator [Sphingobacteriia bacterium]